MTDKELISEWVSRILAAEEFRNRIYSNEQWDRFEGYFRNKFPAVSEKEHDTTKRRLEVQTDSVIADEARRMVPKIVFNLPYISVSPLAGRLTIHAKVLERVINGILETIKAKVQLKMATLSTIQHGTGFLKLGYDSEFVPSYKEIAEVGFSSGAFNKKLERQEFRDDVFPGLPWLLWQHPKNVIIPEMVTDFSGMPWIAYRYWRTVEECQNDKRLSNTKDLKPTDTSYSDIAPTIGNDRVYYNKVKGKILLTEIRDKVSGEMRIFAEGCHKILYKERDVLTEVLGGKLNIYPIVFNANTDWAMGTSDIHLTEEKLKELLDVKTQNVKDRRLRIAKFLYRQSSIKPSELLKLISGDVGAGIEVDGSLEGAVQPFNMPNPMDLAQDAGMLKQEIKSHFGSNAFDTYSQSRRGGAEVVGAQQDAMMPIHERRDIINDLVVEIAKDIAKMIFAFWTEETVVDVLAPVVQEVANEQGQMVPQDVTQKVWVAFKGRELRGNFDYYISASSGRFQDSKQAKEEAFEIMNFFSKIPGVNPQELARQLADRFDGIDADRLFAPMNTPGNAMPMAQLQQMMGGEKMSRQKPNLQTTE